METLKYLLQSKKADCTRPKEVVSNSVAWLHTQFQNAGVAADYAEGGVNFGIYGHFQIKSLVNECALTLHIKITEINGLPYAAAEVHNDQQQILFRYFGEIASEEGKLTLLHYIADFELSTTPEQSAAV